MKVINSKLAPEAIGAYSQGISVQNLVFLSGQLGINRQTGTMQEGIKEQTHQVFKNIEQILAEETLTTADIVKTVVLLSDIENFSVVNEIYSEYIKKPYPARSAYAVKNLPLDGLVEIEVIAIKSDNEAEE